MLVWGQDLRDIRGRKMKHKCSICGKWSEFAGYYPSVSFTNNEEQKRTDYMSAEFICRCGNIENIRAIG